MRQLVALATSGLTLCGMWLAGNHRWQGWLVGLLNQILWFAFILVFSAWGLLPLNLALVGVYSRNLHRWRTAPIDPDVVARLAPWSGGRMRRLQG